MEKIDELNEKVDGMIEYVGEWHSHPDGAGTAPSEDDKQVFAWLEELRRSDGYPATMVIVGAPGDTAFYVGKV